jgi:hypothetical protein
MKNNRSLRKYRITGEDLAQAGEALANRINSLKSNGLIDDCLYRKLSVHAA